MTELSSTVYRSVRVVVQNNTTDVLTVQGGGVMRGQWADKMQARPGQEIGDADAVTWSSESRTLAEGTRAFVRLSSPRGFTTVSWNLPWVGEFDFKVNCPKELRETTSIDNSQPDQVTVLVTFE